METIKLKGTYDFIIRDVNGNIRDTFSVNNIVTNDGKAQLALLAGDASATPFTYIALGSGTTTAAASQTALVTELTTNGLARAVATISRVTTTVTNDTYKAVYTWTASGSSTIEEIGVFNAASSGTMLSRALTGTKSIVNGEKITATYTLAIS